jgi:dolichyl-phosphate beta-glucosyltransferase
MKQQSPQKKQIDLTIVIPAYREEKRIGKTLDELAVYLKINPTLKSLNVEVMVVAADSPDDTDGVVRSKSKNFKKLDLLKPGPKVGKGRDVQFGMLRAKGRAVLFMDADLATPLWHVEQFYKSFERGNEVVVATRNLIKHHPSVLRRAISNMGNILFRVLGGVWIEDSQCGFKLFSARASQVCFSRMTITGWSFDMEILTIARSNGFKIKTYRVNDWVSVPEGTFLEGVLQSSFESLRELLHIFLNRLKGVYKYPRNAA